jgi:hypothetical protein
LQRKIPSLLAYLIENTPMTAEDCAMLEEVLQNKQVVAEVPLQLLPGQCTCHLTRKRHNPFDKFPRGD